MNSRSSTSRWQLRRRRSAAIWLMICICAGVGYGQETPTSSGPVSILDTPILRIPVMATPPKIDGVMDEKEWEDASALSSFWYDRYQAKFLFLAPIETQLQVYAAYDKENLYIAYSSPVYPKNSWFKAMGRFPDVSHHPQYGLIWDDHVELEIRPYHDNVKGFRMGLFKWFFNPIATVSDQYWSLGRGEGYKWQSRTKVASEVTQKRWTIEIAVPLERLRHGGFLGKDADGREIVTIPPPDGTAYRVWFTRAIGGNGAFFNAFDAHSWNTTKTKIILDSRAPSFQINELGPIMDDIIDLELTVKNHNTRSETVRIGFFVESAMGAVYSSYEDDQLSGGLLELVPGEVRKLHLRKKFPGISTNGNVLWFDVRSAGRPAKPLFQTRLVHFHSMEGGRYRVSDNAEVSFREARINVIAKMRPPRKEFDFRYAYSHYQNRVSAVVDRGIYGGSDEAKTAVEAKLTVMTADEEERTVVERTVAFRGDFACFLFDLPKLDRGRYKVSLLLFDRNKRIVGESNPDPFYRPAEGEYKWVKNKVGLDDVVWEPFVPIEVRDPAAGSAGAFETLKHRFTVDASGLPAQIYIKPDVRELLLEKRADPSKVSDRELIAIGRGPQLRAPLRLEAVVAGKRIAAQVVRPAKLVRQWKSELEYRSKLKVGPIDVDMTVQYDCDGAMTVKMDYAARGGEIDAWELVGDFTGGYDMVVSAAHGGGMGGPDRLECTLYPGEGVVWDSAELEHPALFYTHFVPWVTLGSGDRAMTWICDSDEHWMIDRDGSTMTVERDRAGEITWRAKFANHTQPAHGTGTIEFMLLTHPAKPKPKGFRRIAWFQQGDTWAGKWRGRWGEIEQDWPAKLLPREGVRDLPASTPPWSRGYQLRGTCGAFAAYTENALIGDFYGRSFLPPRESKRRYIIDGKETEVTVKGGGGTIHFGRAWEDLFVWHFGLCAIQDGQAGWWWDETWPTYRSSNVASGEAHLRDPKEVGKKELPWQDHFLTFPMRRMFKRLARVYRQGGALNRQYFWANNAATCFESFGYDTLLVEAASSDHASFELDNVVVYPNSQFRFNSHYFTGLVSRVVPRNGESRSEYSRPGDDKRLERQYFGRALLNDIGVICTGPHGIFVQNDQTVPMLSVLAEFGFFSDDGQTEYVPYWRNQKIVRYGEALSDQEALKQRLDPHRDSAAKVYVSAYRRPFERDGKRGYQVLLVIMNENDNPVSMPLHIADPGRLFGGRNLLPMKEAVAGLSLPAGASGDLAAALGKWRTDEVVLKDVEDGGFVKRASYDARRGGTYGNVFVRPHDYRVLYGWSVSDK